MTSYPKFRAVVLDCLDVDELAEFYRSLLGWQYADGAGPEDSDDWRSLVGAEGGRMSFQRVDELPATTWPTAVVPQQLHLDLLAASVDELNELHERVLSLGAELRLDRSDAPHEPLRVYADPAGHTFCLFAWPA